MASRFLEKDSKKCWDILATVLSYGKTVPFVYKRDQKQTYRLTDGRMLGCISYHDDSSEEFLLDDIAFALIDEKLPKVELHLDGKESGPIADFWIFTFTKEGLVSAYSYYNDD